MSKHLVSFRLSGEAVETLRRAARSHAVTMTAVLEWFLRDPTLVTTIAERAEAAEYGDKSST